MKKGSLNIIQSENKVIIKKRPHLADWFVFENGCESELQTASKEQTEELIGLLRSIVFS